MPLAPTKATVDVTNVMLIENSWPSSLCCDSLLWSCACVIQGNVDFRDCFRNVLLFHILVSFIPLI